MIDPQQLQVMADYVERQGLNEQTLSRLRARYTGLHFTWCMDDDIHFRFPVIERDGFNVFLVDSRNHCSTLTRDPEAASGVVFAEIFQE